MEQVLFAALVFCVGISFSKLVFVGDIASQVKPELMSASNAESCSSLHLDVLKLSWLFPQTRC